jgi:hypothetical protein
MNESILMHRQPAIHVRQAGAILGSFSVLVLMSTILSAFLFIEKNESRRWLVNLSRMEWVFP